MAEIVNFFGCLVLKDGRLVKDDVWFRRNKIVSGKDVDFKADRYINCTNRIICPGMVDLKLNGAFGVDFKDPELSLSGIDTVKRMLPQLGVTAFCPTLTTTTPKVYHTNIPKLLQHAEMPNGAEIIGVHLDGPFITVSGGHPPEYIINDHIDMDRVKKVYGDQLHNVSIITLAPEIPGCLETISEFSRRGIQISLGHSRSSFDVGEEAVKNGASLISHLFNAMPTFHHRDPNLVGLVASGSKKKISFGLISDGIHIHPAALRMAYRMAPESLMIVSDGQPPMGLGDDGLFEVYPNTLVRVTKHNNDLKCVLESKADTLFGSVCPLNLAVRKFADVTDCGLAFALDAATRKPAQAMKIFPKKGSLQPGSDADIVVLDRNCNVKSTYIAGQKFYETP